jgi:tetraacyldisaccharide 4'-kinase
MNIFESFYYIGYLLKKKYSFKIQKRLPYPVISIGNITVGGTGKTPLTIALAEESKKRGFFPIILTRGYKGRAKSPCLVEKNKDTLSLVHLYGDEPVLMTDALDSVPIVKSADRYKGGLFALKIISSLKLGKSPIFILDDGFQHWKLYRDLDILLIDFTNPFGKYKLLPSGTLREPLKELKRANIIVITKVEMKDNVFEDIIDKLRTFNSTAPIFLSNLKINSLTNKNSKQFSNEILMNKRIYAFCGIGNPEYFKKNILSLHGNIVGFRAYRDHYNYTSNDLMSILKDAEGKKCDYLITTKKDMIKLKQFDLPDNLLSLDVVFNIGKIFYDHIFENINRVTTTMVYKDNTSTMDHTIGDRDSTEVL